MEEFIDDDPPHASSSSSRPSSSDYPSPERSSPRRNPMRVAGPVVGKIPTPRTGTIHLLMRRENSHEPRGALGLIF